MTRFVAMAACAVLLASAAPACAQVINAGVIPPARMLPGMNSGHVNRVIPGTPSLMPSVVNPMVSREVRTVSRVALVSTKAPLYRSGLTGPVSPALGSANRTNGVVGQGGVSGVTAVNGIRAVGSGPLNQRRGVDRP